MRVLNNEDQPSLEELQHYGTKGMKWGHRKARPSSADIHSARAKISSKQRELGRTIDQLNSVSSGTSKSDKTKAARLVNQYHKQAEDIRKDPARAVAARMTRGEKVAATLILGPLAVVPIAAASHNAKSIEKRQAK